MCASEHAMKLNVCMIKSLSPYSTKLYRPKTYHSFVAGEHISWVLCTQTLAACYQLAQSTLNIGFNCASKKGRIRGGGWAYSRLAVHMVAVLAGCRKAWVWLGPGTHRGCVKEALAQGSSASSKQK